MARCDYDLAVIGAGSGGVRAARMAAQAGARVVVIEGRRVGGTCVLRGCIPKKLLVYAGHFAEDFEDARGFGWQVGERRLDWAALINAKDRETDRLHGVYTRILRENAVEIVDGWARFEDAHTLDIGGRRLTAETVLIAAGAAPAMPAIPGIEHAISSDEALDLKALPERIAIVGGGYIGVEFAGIFAAAGAKVSQIVRAETVLRGFDEDMRLALAEEMRKRGIDLKPDSVVRGIERTGGANGRGALSLRLAHGEEVAVDAVLFATGRRPATERLGLEAAGVATTADGAVKVDAYSRTSTPNIFAVGDVTDRMNLTPVALGEAMAFVRTVFRGEPTAMDYANVPTAVFSSPPLATVGLSEAEARAQVGAVDVYMSRFRPLKHTLSGRDERAVMKLVVDAATDRVLGCHMLGMDAPEIIQGFAVALRCGATKAQFDATVGIHPSAAEEFVTMRDKRPPHAPPAARARGAN